MLATIIFIMLCTPFLWWSYILFKFDSLKHIPGPRGLPFIGNAFDIGKTPQALMYNLNKFCKNYGEVIRIDVLSQVRLLITNPDLARQVMNSTVHISKSNAYDLLKPWLGTGLLTSTGHKWRTRRRLITPTFYYQVLDQFIKVFNTTGDILIQKLAQEVGSASVDVCPYIDRYSLDIICETAMGVKIGAQDGRNPDYVNAVRCYLAIFVNRMFSWKKFNLLFRFSSLYPDYKKSLKIMHSFTNNVIDNRRWLKDKHRQTGNRDDGIKRKVTLLDMLLELEDSNTLSNEDIREEIETFMVAGHDPISSALEFTLLALAENSKVQDKVFEEIISVTGNNPNITMQTLKNVRYLEMVIKESLRMYPPIPGFERELMSDFKLGDYQCPKGTVVSVFTYGIHHDTNNFPDPDKFDPDRFLPENQSLRHTFAYVPFSAGPRNCIGQKFAMLEMKSTVIKVVQNFRILTVPNFKPEIGVAGSLKSYNGIFVKLEKRSG